MGWTAAVQFSSGARYFSSMQGPDRLRELSSLLQWTPGDLSPEIKRPGREVHHSSPSTTEVEKSGTPSFSHTSWRRSAYVITYRDNFACTVDTPKLVTSLGKSRCTENDECKCAAVTPNLVFFDKCAPVNFQQLECTRFGCWQIQRKHQTGHIRGGDKNWWFWVQTLTIECPCLAEFGLCDFRLPILVFVSTWRSSLITSSRSF
jgi:hypothetical protein